MGTEVAVLLAVSRALGSAVILGGALLGLWRIAQEMLLRRPGSGPQGGQAHAPGTATATLLFTDIVESTELITRFGDETADRLRAAHFGLLRQAVADTRGVVVKTLGDGLMAAFTSTVEAIHCAAAMQDAVATENSRGHEPTVGLRVGMSVGETTVEGSDYFGTPVVEAARLCAQATSGQILASDLVRVLAGSRSRYPLLPRGGQQLKGLAGPLPVCEVLWGEPLQIATAG